MKTKLIAAIVAVVERGTKPGSPNFMPVPERIARLDKARDEANPKGWTVVNRKGDWKAIFPK